MYVDSLSNTLAASQQTEQKGESEEWSSQSIFQFKKIGKKKPEKNQGFNGIRTRNIRDAGAMLYQLSYETTHWKRGQFIEFISPLRSETIWSVCEIIHIWTEQT